MHELAIADSIAQIAMRHANGRRITTVHVRVGHLRQVVPSALTFSFELVTRGTLLQDAMLEIEEIPAQAECDKCGAQTDLEAFPLQCEKCASPDLNLITGEELYVDYLELEDTPPLSEGRSAASPEPAEVLTSEGRSEASPERADEPGPSEARPKAG